jgi:hypothetical protein
MDSKHCSTCIQKLLLSSFLKDSTATANSHVYATCIQCQQKSMAHRAATSKKQPALQPLDPNIQPSKRLKTCPTHPKLLDPTPLPLTPVLAKPSPILYPIISCPAILASAPPEPFLHCSRYTQKLPLSSFLKDSTTTANSCVYAICIQCQQRVVAHRAATSKKWPTL